ncbi:ABC transporter ATP-binding protein [Luteimonas sp. RD2P54]|uniref:ABC transporter ATP-binding protein n=1 Tax=Luteimonas endophytica TaxID=3042023 RepID=A0ABT6J9B3_9GAMM|nr:ABC transporter ATP-binding protein [Luteimonas endophytica]MDH5823339.1 ABC transporter ATP-binding protein [Luteimonas endophytica]
MRTATGAAPLLALERVRVGYPAPGGLHVVVDELSLALRQGEIGCLLGASGCGKTTVLRAIAGFEPVRAGRILLQGAVVAEPRRALAPERRRVGMMFQDYALFPHLSVAGNVGFGLRRLRRAAREARVAAMLELVGLGGAAADYPHELSGGQQQRVALARALAPEPALLLLDEPFSNLDVDTRGRLAHELRALLRATGATALLVSHDQAEAFAMADRIGVMERGRILQWDSAEALYRRPAHRFVADFIGRGALVPGTAVGLEAELEVLLRPECLLHDPEGPIRGVLLEAGFRGPGYVGSVRLDSGEVVEVDLAEAAPREPGAALALRLAEGPLVTFPRQ